MHVIIWEFQVRAERRNEFIAAYNADGAWAQLFRQATGYLGTELLCAEEAPAIFLTIDRWSTADDFKAFQEDFEESYQALDAACASLTTSERKIGSFAAEG